MSCECNCNTTTTTTTTTASSSTTTVPQPTPTPLLIDKLKRILSRTITTTEAIYFLTTAANPKIQNPGGVPSEFSAMDSQQWIAMVAYAYILKFYPNYQSKWTKEMQALKTYVVNTFTPVYGPNAFANILALADSKLIVQ